MMRTRVKQGLHGLMIEVSEDNSSRCCSSAEVIELRRSSMVPCCCRMVASFS